MTLKAIAQDGPEYINLEDIDTFELLTGRKYQEGKKLFECEIEEHSTKIDIFRGGCEQEGYGNRDKLVLKASEDHSYCSLSDDNQLTVKATSKITTTTTTRNNRKEKHRREESKKNRGETSASREVTIDKDKDHSPDDEVVVDEKVIESNEDRPTNYMASFSTQLGGGGELINIVINTMRSNNSRRVSSWIEVRVVEGEGTKLKRFPIKCEGISLEQNQ